MWRKLIFILSSAVSMLQASTHESNEVAVVGAGLAGLTAAYRLQQAGFNVKVFEATERPGGRVLTYYQGSSHEELGGKFLDDGVESKEIRALIQELGLSIESYEIPWTATYLHDGKPAEMFNLFENVPPPTDENYLALKSQTESEHFLTVVRRFLKDHPELLRILELRFANYEGTALINWTLFI
jgi:monoamine oxidase